MKFSVITDELSSDFDTALELAVEMGFDGVEIRGIGEGRYPRVSDLMLRAVPEFCREYGLPVVSVSPGLFKIRYPQRASDDARALRWDHRMSFDDEQLMQQELRFQLEELLPATIEAARAVGSPLVNTFSFDRGGASVDAPIPDGVIRALKNAACKAAEAGLILSIENEANCWGATSDRTASLVEMISEPNVGITWDPANAFRVGEDAPFPNGYGRVRPYIRHVHFKNARIDPRTGERHFSFDGVIDWRGQLSALGKDGYDGYVSVETHQRPKLRTSRRYFDQLRALALVDQTTKTV